VLNFHRPQALAKRREKMLEMQGGKTTISGEWDREDVLTGSEVYPVAGSFLSLRAVTTILKCLDGLQVQAQCLEKAQIVQRILKHACPCEIKMGSLYLLSADGQSSYGYAFNLPHEFHAWLVPLDGPGVIIDFALPGVVIRGSILKDEIGPFLVGRSPVILAGTPLPWMKYTPVDIITVG
jgi:hypothetical protein